MKLVIAIVNNDDAHFVNTGLVSSGFHVTKISSTGGFLMSGNSTFLLGVEEERLDKVLEVIKTHSRQRVQSVPTLTGNPMMFNAADTTVKVGGATVFVIDVEKALRF